MRVHEGIGIIANKDINTSSADAVAVAAWNDLFSYQVPMGKTWILRAEDIFWAYLSGKDAELDEDETEVKVEVRDASQQDRRCIFGPLSYLAVKTESFHFLLKFPLLIKERDYIVVMVKAPTICVAKKSHFVLQSTILFPSPVVTPTVEPARKRWWRQ